MLYKATVSFIRSQVKFKIFIAICSLISYSVIAKKNQSPFLCIINVYFYSRVKHSNTFRSSDKRLTAQSYQLFSLCAGATNVVNGNLQ